MYAQYEYIVLTNFSNSFFIKRIVFFRKVIQMIYSVSTVVTIDVNIFSPNQSLQVYHINS